MSSNNLFEITLMSSEDIQGNSKLHYPKLWFITSHSNVLEYLGVNDFTSNMNEGIAFPSLESAQKFLFDSYGEDTMLEIHVLVREQLIGQSKFLITLELAWSN